VTGGPLQRFGAEGPGPDGLDAPYWDGLRAGELRIQRCGNCARWIWTAEPMCPDCHTFDPGWEAVAPDGVVHTWTRTWNRFHPAAASPYTTVLVELPRAGGRRVLGLWTAADDPVIGVRTRGEFEPAPDETT
jgi:uncharacterized OB-fold protein